jgi:aspartokinase
MYDDLLEGKLRQLFQSHFPKDLHFREDLIRQSPTEILEQKFIGYGEVMSAQVLSHILDTRFQVANNIIDHMIHVAENGRGLSALLRDEVGMRVNNLLPAGIAIVPGYVSVRGNSVLGAYGRGYTDKIAERIAVGLAHLGESPVLHIQKQVPLLSSNPNHISAALPIQNLSYWSTAEITGSRGANAQVLNEHTVSRELSEKDIPIWVYNPFMKDAPRSVVSMDGNTESGIQFVDGRDHVSTITVSGFAMS